MVAYTVTAKFTGPDLVDGYVRWLSLGHVREVCQAGASDAQVTVLDTPAGEPRMVSVRYLFPDRQALAAYIADHAPRLRAEGLERFGPTTGVVFERSTGLVAHTESRR